MKLLRLAAAFASCLIALAANAEAAPAPDATALLRTAFDNWRGGSSETTLAMTIHRPSWERRLSMKAWTQGDAKALVRFVGPAKDAGNATLTLGEETWIYDPKLNQTIKLPASMVAQSWMGSDFSNSDLSKSEALLTQYTHRIVATASVGGHKVFTIEATPNPGAPVVWGKQVVKVRDDGVFLEEIFFDQTMKPVRAMTTDKVGTVGGRAYPVVVTMRPTGQPGEWTTIETTGGRFGLALPPYVFTLSNLENPRG